MLQKVSNDGTMERGTALRLLARVKFVIMRTPTYSSEKAQAGDNLGRNYHIKKHG